MKNHLPVLSLAFCAGIVFASRINICFSWAVCFLLTGLVLSLLFFKARRLFIILMICLAFFLGAAAFINAERKPKDDIANFILYKNHVIGTCLVKGVVESNPEIEGGRENFVLRAEEIQINNLRHSCSGSVSARLGFIAGLRYGDKLILRGNIFRSRYLLPGISAAISVKTPLALVKLNCNHGNKIKALAIWLKNNFTLLIYQYSAGIPAAVIEAMVLGEKRNVPFPVYDAMVKSGTVHILVVSGFNTGIVAALIILILKILRIPRKPRVIISAILLIIYCFIAGASTPVVRATIMSLVFLSAYFFRRLAQICNSLALAAVCILIVNPRQLFNIGFQLSFISVFSIVYFYPRLSCFLHTERLKIPPLRFIIDSLLVSFSAWLGTAGLIAYYFKIVSPLAVFANLFIVPLSSLITLCGLSALFVALIFPCFAGLFAASAELLVWLLLAINSWLIKLPGAYFYISTRCK